MLEVPLPSLYAFAPAGTPEILRQAFEAVAACLSLAIQLRRAASPVLPQDDGIEGLLRPEQFPAIRALFFKRLQQARERFVEAEIPLTAGSPAGLKRAHWLAWEACARFGTLLCTSDPNVPIERQLKTIHRQIKTASTIDEFENMMASAKAELCRAVLLVTPSHEERPSDDWLDLREFAANKLKGIERRIVELVCDGGGSCPLADLAIDSVIGWNPPCDDQFNSARKRLNKKLKSIRAQIYRHDGKARVKRLGRE